MKPYFIKVGCFLIFIFAILNFLGLKQTEFEIRQLDSTARILTTHAEAIQAALAALLIFAIVDANRINRSLSELQQTVNYEERLEPLLFYGATAETAETAATAETAKTLEPELNFTVTKSGIVPDDGSYVPVTLGDVTVCIPVAAAGQGRCTVTYCSGNSTAAIGDYKMKAGKAHGFNRGMIGRQ